MEMWKKIANLLQVIQNFKTTAKLTTFQPNIANTTMKTEFYL